MAARRNNIAAKLNSAMALMIASGFALLFCKTPDLQTAVMGFTVTVVFLMVNMLLPKVFFADGLLTSLITFLCSIGILILSRISPARGISQGINYLIGLVAMVMFMLFVRHLKLFRRLPVPVALASLGLMVLPIVFGREQSGAKAWVALGGFTFQPSELVKVTLIMVNAVLLSRRKLLLSMAFTGICLLTLVLQKDMGTAMLYYVTALSMMYVATGSIPLLTGGIVGAGTALVLGYNLLKRMGFAHIDRRITAWLNPWGSYENEGFQTVQSLLAIVNGGPFGMGLGVGNASRIPLRDTDSIFPFIVNEMGIIFGVCMILIYIMILLRGVGIAMRCNGRFHALAALGCSVMLAFQTFVIIGGNINLIPITGVTLPFISYGGTSMLASLSLTGVLLGIESCNDHDIAEDARLATGEDVLK